MAEGSIWNKGSSALSLMLGRQKSSLLFGGTLWHGVTATPQAAFHLKHGWFAVAEAAASCGPHCCLQNVSAKLLRVERVILYSLMVYSSGTEEDVHRKSLNSSSPAPPCDLSEANVSGHPKRNWPKTSLFSSLPQLLFEQFSCRISSCSLVLGHQEPGKGRLSLQPLWPGETQISGGVRNCQSHH